MTKVTVRKKEVSQQIDSLRAMGYSILTTQERQEGESKMDVMDIFFEPKIKMIAAEREK
jgi:hypothetical protein